MTQPVCAVSGAGPGNGRAFAERFAEAGYQVALIARNAERLREQANAIAGAHAYPCDIGDGERVSETFAAIENDLGAVDTLLFNGGGAIFGSIDRVGADDFEAAWRAHALGLFHCAQAVIANMRAAGRGHIVVTGATASRKGGANFAAFAAAKAAQRSLAESLARQLGPDGIHVAIAIIDGVIASRRTRAAFTDKAEADFLQPEAIAEAVYQVTEQPRTAWTFEFDLRPYSERW